MSGSSAPPAGSSSNTGFLALAPSARGGAAANTSPATPSSLAIPSSSSSTSIPIATSPVTSPTSGFFALAPAARASMENLNAKLEKSRSERELSIVRRRSIADVDLKDPQAVTERLEELAEEEAALRSECVALQSKRESMIRRQVALEERLAAVDRNRALLNNRILDLEQKMAETHTKLEAMQQHGKKGEEQLKELMLHHDKLATEILQMEEEKVGLVRTLDMTQDQLKDLKDKEKVLAGQHEKKMKEIAKEQPLLVEEEKKLHEVINHMNLIQSEAEDGKALPASLQKQLATMEKNKVKWMAAVAEREARIQVLSTELKKLVTDLDHAQTTIPTLQSTITNVKLMYATLAKRVEEHSRNIRLAASDIHAMREALSHLFEQCLAEDEKAKQLDRIHASFQSDLSRLDLDKKLYTTRILDLKSGNDTLSNRLQQDITRINEIEEMARTLARAGREDTDDVDEAESIRRRKQAFAPPVQVPVTCHLGKKGSNKVSGVITATSFLVMFEPDEHPDKSVRKNKRAELEQYRLCVDLQDVISCELTELELVVAHEDDPHALAPQVPALNPASKSPRHLASPTNKKSPRPSSAAPTAPSPQNSSTSATGAPPSPRTLPSPHNPAPRSAASSISENNNTEPGPLIKSPSTEHVERIFERENLVIVEKQGELVIKLREGYKNRFFFEGDTSKAAKSPAFGDQIQCTGSLALLRPLRESVIAAILYHERANLRHLLDGTRRSSSSSHAYFPSEDNQVISQVEEKTSPSNSNKPRAASQSASAQPTVSAAAPSTSTNSGGDDDGAEDSKTTEKGRSASLARSEAERHELHLEDQFVLISGSSGILSDSQLQQLVRCVPKRYHLDEWRMRFSISRDGTLLKTFYHRMEDFPCSLLIIKDSNGKVFGCFASRPFRQHHLYYGTGETFVWELSGEKLKTYKWTGANNFFMLSNDSAISLGGGGGFALTLDAMLEKGTSTVSKTFNNPVLSSKEDFVCHLLEAWAPPEED